MQKFVRGLQKTVDFVYLNKGTIVGLAGCKFSGNLNLIRLSRLT